MNEEILKARQSADLLCQDLIALHKKICANSPTVEQLLAESYVLGLINKAVDIKLSICGVGSIQ